MVFSCTPDYDVEYISFTHVPEELKIQEASGIKLQSNIVSNEVNINVKLPSDGTYKIKLLDLTNKVVSQEKITANQGDNLLKIYVKSLPVSSYKVELLTESNMLLGKEIFAIKN
jgi:hypothetical protein